MEVSIAIIGSRSFNDYLLLKKVINELIKEEGYVVKEIVSGGANGADKLGHRYAIEHNYSFVEYPADWDTYGKRAGYMRNQQIVDRADIIVAFWDGISKGTKHSIDIAMKLDKPVFVLQ